jgi:hypothetical protein
MARSAAALAVLLASVAPLLAGAEPVCDPYLRPPANDPLGYQARGDRCEGRYIADVAGTTLHIASFTRSFENYELTAGGQLDVHWPPAGRAPVRLQGMGLRPRLYYRMDTTRPLDQSPFRWPTAVLAGLGIARPDLGVVAWARLPVGSAEQPVYLPVTVGQGSGGAPARSYRIVVWPGRELTEVFVTLAPAGDDGRPGRPVRSGQPLRHGFYPADRGIPIAIPFTELGRPGLYHLLIAATIRGGGAASLEAWFHHPGP